MEVHPSTQQSPPTRVHPPLRSATHTSTVLCLSPPGEPSGMNFGANPLVSHWPGGEYAVEDCETSAHINKEYLDFGGWENSRKRFKKGIFRNITSKRSPFLDIFFSSKGCILSISLPLDSKGSILGASVPRRLGNHSGHCPMSQILLDSLGGIFETCLNAQITLRGCPESSFTPLVSFRR